MKSKIIFLFVTVFFFGIGYLIDYHQEKVKEENTKTVITELGDEFIITTSTDLLGKTTLINKDKNFSYRIHYYDPEDNIELLCNTENVTIYQLSDVKFCKIKKYDKYISLERYDEDNIYVYKYLNDIVDKDEKASKYLNPFLNRYYRGENKWNTNTKN